MPAHAGVVGGSIAGTGGGAACVVLQEAGTVWKTARLRAARRLPPSVVLASAT